MFASLRNHARQRASAAASNTMLASRLAAQHGHCDAQQGIRVLSALPGFPQWGGSKSDSSTDPNIPGPAAPRC
eukprot:3241322-Prymnesium_polylepis.1